MRLVCLAALGVFLACMARGEPRDLPGDTADNPLPISSLPFSASGNTCDYTHQYDEFCPIDGQNAPDVVYAYTATESVVVNLSLCESSYDTKILVYENDAYTGNLYACNDDWCSGPNYEWPWLAYLRELPLNAGNTYYFVVDGYSTASCGQYVLRIAEAESCDLVCPPGGLEESEPKCVSGVADSINGGCAHDPPAFELVPPSPDRVAFCSFTNANDSNHHDQDWYELILPAPDTVTVAVQPDVAAYVTVFDGNAGCPDPPVLAWMVVQPCELASREIALEAGPAWIRVRPLLLWGVLCPSEYILTVDGYDGSVTAIPAPVPGFTDRLTIAPNPSVGAASIQGYASGTGAVIVRVHDVRGRIVRTLPGGTWPPGFRDVAWDGRDDRGRIVPAGIYFCRWKDGELVRTARIVRIGS